MKFIVAIALGLTFCIANADIEFRDFALPEQEQTYESLISELRCLVCQNQTIADSNADLAKDLRRQVYEMIRQGKSREDVVQFMTQRYGDFVLYKPAFNPKTWLLWLGPAVFLLGGLLTAILVVRQKKRIETPQISSEQQTQLDDLLKEGNEE